MHCIEKCYHTEVVDFNQKSILLRVRFFPMIRRFDKIYEVWFLAPQLFVEIPWRLKVWTRVSKFPTDTNPRAPEIISYSVFIYFDYIF
jgi:hypothetical protein